MYTCSIIFTSGSVPVTGGGAGFGGVYTGSDAYDTGAGAGAIVSVFATSGPAFGFLVSGTTMPDRTTSPTPLASTRNAFFATGQFIAAKTNVAKGTNRHTTPHRMCSRNASPISQIWP